MARILGNEVFLANILDLTLSFNDEFSILETKAVPIRHNIFKIQKKKENRRAFIHQQWHNFEEIKTSRSKLNDSWTSDGSFAVKRFACFLS